MKKTLFSSYFLYNPHEIKLLVEEDVRVHCALQVVHVQVPVLAGRPAGLLQQFATTATGVCILSLQTKTFFLSTKSKSMSCGTKFFSSNLIMN